MQLQLSRREAAPATWPSSASRCTCKSKCNRLTFSKITIIWVSSTNESLGYFELYRGKSSKIKAGKADDNTREG